jgi:two-component system nitrate/nitrite response regulator NarL
VRLRPDLELVGHARSGHDAVRAIAELRPAVAVVELRLPGLDGRGVLDAVVHEQLDTRVLMLAGRRDAPMAYAAIEAGAAGYLFKEADADQICDGIARVARGQTVLAPRAQTELADEIRLRRRDGRPLLSERERQVLELVADGRTAPEMAQLLNLGLGTVKSHLRHVYDKLGVRERAAAVAEAMRRGVLQ